MFSGINSYFSKSQKQSIWWLTYETYSSCDHPCEIPVKTSCNTGAVAWTGHHL